MGDWLDTPGEVLAVLTILSIILGLLVWVIRAVGSLDRQTKPNGGSSLRDAFDRLEANLSDVHTDVREIRKAQVGHLEWHLGKDAN